jgi:hypothetical protein
MQWMLFLLFGKVSILQEMISVAVWTFLMIRINETLRKSIRSSYPDALGVLPSDLLMAFAKTHCFCSLLQKMPMIGCMANHRQTNALLAWRRNQDALGGQATGQA